MSKATRNLIEPHPIVTPGSTDGTQAVDDDDDSEPEVESGVEGIDPEDIEVAPETINRQSAAARNRRLLRNFIRRNLRALEYPGFRDGAGPGVVVLNLIILNWLCWWVATRDEERGKDLIDERLRLWHPRTTTTTVRRHPRVGTPAA